MSDQHTSRRIRERIELKLPVRVACRELSDFEWRPKWKRYDNVNSTVRPIQHPETIQLVSVDQCSLTRHSIAVDMQLETIDEQGNANQTEMTSPRTAVRRVRRCIPRWQFR